MWMMVVLLTLGVPKVGYNFGVAIGYFLPGVMAYVCFGRWRPRLPVGLLPVFLGALWVAFLLHANFHRGWIACLLLGLGLPMFRQMSAEWAIVPSRIIAKYSYGAYLTHPFAIVVGIYLLRGHSLGVQLLAEAVLLVALPAAAYHWLEHPMIRLGDGLPRVRRNGTNSMNWRTSVKRTRSIASCSRRQYGVVGGYSGGRS
jgi:peptidoglycan/LPS O-acetylase OafA/YrhL